MRSASSAVVSALTNARDTGIVPRKFLTATVKDRDTGEAVVKCFWSGDWTVTAEVISGETGEAEERVFVGGVGLDIGEIPRVADLTVQTVDVGLSPIADPVQVLVRQYDARLAPVEIHTGLLDPMTRQMVEAAEIEFLGQIDGAPIETAGAGDESRLTLAVRSGAILMLTRKNPRKRSYEGQKRRSGDAFGRYANSVASWQVSWGQEAQ